MERKMDFHNSGSYAGYENAFETDPMVNPVLQYEQAYMYYKYLTQQVEYRIKCKEYDKIARGDVRRVE